MELKSYDKYWLQAAKGAFLIIFGVLGFLKIYGSIQTLAVFFGFLIGMIAFLSVLTGVYYKKNKHRIWTVVSGVLNLLFALYIISYIGDRAAENLNVLRSKIIWGIIFWTIFYGITELIEAGILFYSRNAFGVLFLINALLTILFSYALYVLITNFDEQRLINIAIVALVFGITNVLSAYLLSISTNKE